MIVAKFGGSSLATTDRMRAVARIVAEHARHAEIVCVVSAMGGVTDALLCVADLTTRGETVAARAALGALRERHAATYAAFTATDPFPPAPTPAPATPLDEAWRALEADAAVLAHLADLPDVDRYHAVAAFSGWGERLSVLLVAAALAARGLPAEAYRGEPVIVAERRAQPGGAPLPPAERAAPSVAATRAHLAPALAGALRAGRVAVVPGYLARTVGGRVTTVGRNGSDYSAAVIAAALGAERAYIYSDVSGVHRADPRAVPKASVLPRLTYADAAEIAGAGAKVLHPGTLRPLAAAGIPLHLRSALAPRARGTDITLTVEDDAGDAAPQPWVVVARPLAPERTVYGVSFGHEPGLVEVQGVFLRHEPMDAREDDHLTSIATALAPAAAEPEPGSGPITGALALLLRAPQPVGLALSPRHVSVGVPAAEAVAAQRRLYMALANHDEHRRQSAQRPPDDTPRWRVPS